MNLKILEKQEIISSPEWVEKALEIDAMVLTISTIIWLIVLFSIAFVNTRKKKFIPKNIMFSLLYFIEILMVICLISAICFEVCRHILKVPTGKYEYNVIIEDDASFKHIYHNYDIITNEDNVWILRDK